MRYFSKKLSLFFAPLLLAACYPQFEKCEEFEEPPLSQVRIELRQNKDKDEEDPAEEPTFEYSIGTIWAYDIGANAPPTIFAWVANKPWLLPDLKDEYAILVVFTSTIPQPKGK